MLNSKILPQKTYTELLDESVSKIPIYTGEWTNYNPSDPGITILENLVGAQILQQNQMDKVSDDVKAKLLKLLGYAPKKGKGARVYLEPSYVSERFWLPADQKFMVGGLCYETNRGIEITDSHIIGLYRKQEEVVQDLSYVLDPQISMLARIFGKKPKNQTELYIVMDKPLLPGEQGIIHVDVVSDYGRNPFTKEQKCMFAKLKWECFCETGFEEMEVEDGTVGFLMDGEIVFTQPVNPAAFYEEGMIKGYVWRATLEQSDYDVAPALENMSGFLFQVVQKKTLAMTHSYQKSTDIIMRCDMLDDGYITVFAKEQKGSSYRKYEEYVEDIGATPQSGRYYQKKKKDKNEIEFIFNKDVFGNAPANVKNAVKILVYNEEMMQKYYLGDVYGYDYQEINLPVRNVVTETFCIIARREDGQGGYLYDFLKPNKMDEKKMSYYLFENEGKIVILDAGDYIGASLFLGSIAVIEGEDGNVRKGNVFYCQELDMTFRNPSKGEGGCLQETLEQVRRRFVADMNIPQTAVIMEDYKKLIKNIPGLCIAKANAWRDDDRNEVQVVIMPKLDQEFPRMNAVYQKTIEQFLETKRLLSTSIRILQPMYVPVHVNGKIYVKPHFRNSDVTIKETVIKELDYIHGMKDFGEPLRFDKIFHALDALECVAYVFELNVEAANSEYVIAEGADLYPAKNCLLYPGRITLEILPSADV